MTVTVDVNGRRYAVDVIRQPSARGRNGSFLVSVDGRQQQVDVSEVGGVLSLLIGLKSYEVVVAASTVHVDGVPVEVGLIADRPSWARGTPGTPGGSADGAEGPQRIAAPMPGKVVKLLVKAGDRVAPRQGVVVVEAMKMENELRARAGGTVKEVRVVEGMTVEAGAILVILD